MLATPQSKAMTGHRPAAPPGRPGKGDMLCDDPRNETRENRVRGGIAG